MHDPALDEPVIQLHTVKTRLALDELEYLQRVAEQEERSIAYVLRRLVREAKDERSREDVLS